MLFADFLTRLDEELAQQILGRQAIQILNILDSNLTRISQLQKAILNVYSPVELFTKKNIRNNLFDLLRPEEVEELLALLRKPLTGDQYSTLKSVRLSSQVDLEVLLNYFQIPIPVITEIEVKPYEDNQVTAYPLFKHQRAAIRELVSLLYEGRKRVLLHMPTGSGKTRTAINAVCNHLRQNEPTLVIWLAHTEELCEQAAEEFERAWNNLGDRELGVYRYWGSSPTSLETIRDGFVVSGLMKVYNLLKKDSLAISRLAHHTTLVVMDEAHMAVAPTFKDSINIITSFGASLLGLSATPGRTWNDRNADRELSEFFDKKKVTLKVEGYHNPVDYLVAEGYLAKVQNSPLLYESGIKVSKEDLDYLQAYLELPESYLKKLSEDQARNIRIIQKVEELIEKHQRIILFALNVEHANLLATCLQARNIPAYSVTSNTESCQRRRLIEQFKQDTSGPMVLCNYGILTTGFDAPRTSCAVICRPTDSLVLYSQMVGRAIRGPRAGGNEEAEIVTVVDTNLPGFNEVQQAFFNWEDVW